MSVAGLGKAGCGCIGIPVAFLTNNMESDPDAPALNTAPCYLLNGLFCGDNGVIKLIGSPGSNVFSLTDSFGIDDDPNTITMTIANFDAEGITIEWRNNSGDLVWKATNLEHFNPAQDCPLSVLFYDPNFNQNFNEHPCLVPLPLCVLPDVPSSNAGGCNCGCEADVIYLFLVTISGGGVGSSITPDDFRDCIDGLCKQWQGSYVIVAGETFSYGCYGGVATGDTYTSELCGSSTPAEIGLNVSFCSTPNTHIEVHLGGNSPGTDVAGQITLPIPFIEWAHSGASVTFQTSGYPYDPCTPITVTVTPLAINSNGLPVDCEGERIDVSRCPRLARKCGGTASYKIIRNRCQTSPDKNVYGWHPVVDECSGACAEAGEDCYAQIPYEISEDALTDEEADGLGLLDLYNNETVVAGACGCQNKSLNYVTPEDCGTLDCSSDDCTYTVVGYSVIGSSSGPCGDTDSGMTIPITSESATFYLSVDSACGIDCGCPTIPSEVSDAELLALLGIGSFPTDCSLVGYTFSLPCENA